MHISHQLTIFKQGPHQPYIPAVQTRMFANRNPHHINYPVIPRWRDRARLRRMQRQLSLVLPEDLPPWSVRAEVPITPQPDESEEGGYLSYDGFSTGFLQAYLTALDQGKVPLIPIPYRDGDMKKWLVEKGLRTSLEADRLIVAGQEHWRGPMEYMEDEKHKEEMRQIEESGGID
jgi:hypothetical protein